MRQVGLIPRCAKGSCARRSDEWAGPTLDQTREGDKLQSATQSLRDGWGAMSTGHQRSDEERATAMEGNDMSMVARSEVVVVEESSDGGESDGASSWGVAMRATGAQVRTEEERNARLAAVGMEASGGLVGTMSEGVWQEVCRRMEKGVVK